jgi:hypothetical protein
MIEHSQFVQDGPPMDAVHSGVERNRDQARTGAGTRVITMAR